MTPVDDAPLFQQESVDRLRRLAYLQRMATLSIIKFPDPILRQQALAVEAVDDHLRGFLNQMLETMHLSNGIGLAAPQVGISRRIIVMDTARDEESPYPFMLINPQIVSVGDVMRAHEEGCLSIPDIYAEVERPGLVRVRYVDQDGNPREEDFADLQATVIQHEIDHLNGVLFIDHLSRLKRDLLVKKFLKAQRE